jgi:phosphate transport system substrate-binding protein
MISLAAAIGMVLMSTAVMGGNMQQATSNNAAERTGARMLSYEGATTIGTKIMPEAAKLFAARTGVTFSQIGGAGADAGFRAAEERRVDMGGVARELTPAERSKVAGAVVIGYDAMGVFVKVGNRVKSLTRAQLKEIFAGRATNWKAFGGLDKPITVYSEKLTGGRATVKAFKDMVLGSEAYGPVKEREDATDYMTEVATDETAIAASSMSFAVPGARAIAVDGAPPTTAAVQDGSYPLKRPLILVTKDPPAGNVKAFLDFMLTRDAQTIVGKNFVAAK